jgi:hypothetical protein
MISFEIMFDEMIMFPFCSEQSLYFRQVGVRGMSWQVGGWRWEVGSGKCVFLLMRFALSFCVFLFMFINFWLRTFWLRNSALRVFPVETRLTVYRRLQIVP